MFHNRRPLAVLLIMVLGVSIVAQQSMVLFSAYASESSPYDSGYDHGCDDAGRSESDKYINEPGKGPSFHTNEFMDGYNDGFYVCSSGTNNHDSDCPDYFLDENLSSSSDIDRDGNVTLGAECQMASYFNNCLSINVFTSTAV